MIIVWLYSPESVIPRFLPQFDEITLKLGMHKLDSI